MNRQMKIWQDEQGGTLILVVLMISLMVTGMGFYFFSSNVMFKKTLVGFESKTEIINDRNRLSYDLSHRPLPTPGP